MKISKLLRERVLSLMGILLIAIAADGFLSPRFSGYSSPTLGGVAPIATTPETISQIVAITDWPLYVPLLIGCVLVALDAYYFFTKNKVKIA